MFAVEYLPFKNTFWWPLDFVSTERPAKSTQLTTLTLLYRAKLTLQEVFEQRCHNVPSTPTLSEVSPQERTMIGGLCCVLTEVRLPKILGMVDQVKVSFACFLWDYLWCDGHCTPCPMDQIPQGWQHLVQHLSFTWGSPHNWRVQIVWSCVCIAVMCFSSSSWHSHRVRQDLINEQTGFSFRNSWDTSCPLVIVQGNHPSRSGRTCFIHLLRLIIQTSLQKHARECLKNMTAH